MESMEILFNQLQSLASLSDDKLNIEISDEQFGVKISIGSNVFTAERLNIQTLSSALMFLSLSAQVKHYE
jgi:hypothetical protein